MGASVQFVGKNAVIKAFDKIDNPRWSLWPNSKDMLASHSDSDTADSQRELEDWLEMIRGNTTGIFTLKFYDKGVKEIKPSTPNNYAFNFRLKEDESMSGAPGGGSIDRFLDKLTERFDKLDKRMDEIEKGDDEEPIKPWERALENPIIMAGIGKLFNLDLKGIGTAEKISGVPVDPIDKSIDTLTKNDPDFPNHIGKLAQLSETNPKQFKFLIGMLDQMKI
jgi:hypothetical protein